METELLSYLLKLLNISMNKEFLNTWYVLEMTQSLSSIKYRKKRADYLICKKPRQDNNYKREKLKIFIFISVR